MKEIIRTVTMPVFEVMMSMSVATGLLSPILWDSCSVVQSAGAETSVLCDSATVQGPGSFSHSSGPWMSRAECPGWTRGRNDWAGDLGVSLFSPRGIAMMFCRRPLRMFFGPAGRRMRGRTRDLIVTLQLLGFCFFFILFPPWVRSASYSEEFPLSYVLTVP